MRTKWIHPTLVKGSEAKLKANKFGRKGTCATLKNRENYEPAYFSGVTTAILGTAYGFDMFLSPETIAEWEIYITPSDFNKCENIFIVTGCLRKNGRCHSERNEQYFQIYLNDVQIEVGWLKRKGYWPNQKDNLPKNQSLGEIANCPTVYLFPVPKDKFECIPLQKVRIKTAKFVRWDIDYISVLAEVPDNLAFLRDIKQIIYRRSKLALMTAATVLLAALLSALFAIQEVQDILVKAIEKLF